jgi:hypothetical protein
MAGATVVPAQHHGVTLVSKNQSWLMTVSMIVLALAAVIGVIRFVTDPMDGVTVTVEQPTSSYRTYFPNPPTQ